MYDYFKTIDELSIETTLRFIETKDIRDIAAREMLSSRVFEKENKTDLKFLEMGLGDSIEFKGV
jgi:hypothetical protein